MVGGKEGSPQAVMIEEILDSITLFTSSFDKFISVFDKEYAGGDFCAGITFGMYGTKMLQKVATMLYEQQVK